jgi:hypothetical protein
MPVKTVLTMETVSPENVPTNDKPAKVDEATYKEAADVMVTANELLQLLYDTAERNVVSGYVFVHAVPVVDLATNISNNRMTLPTHPMTVEGHILPTICL